MFKYFQSWSESKKPYFAHDPYNIFLITGYNFIYFEKNLILRITRLALEINKILDTFYKK